MDRIIKMTKEDNVEEHIVSIYIQQILYELNQYSNQSDQSMENKIKQAIAYIEELFQQDITLEESSILESVLLLRYLKNLWIAPPIQYLINFRVNHAKKLLHNTTLSIEEIAAECGFNSTPHFITTFKKVRISSRSNLEISFFSKLVYRETATTYNYCNSLLKVLYY